MPRTANMTLPPRSPEPLRWTVDDRRHHSLPRRGYELRWNQSNVAKNYAYDQVEPPCFPQGRPIWLPLGNKIRCMSEKVRIFAPSKQ